MFEVNSTGGRFGRIRWKNTTIAKHRFTPHYSMYTQFWGFVEWDRNWPQQPPPIRPHIAALNLLAAELTTSFQKMGSAFAEVEQAFNQFSEIFKKP